MTNPLAYYNAVLIENLTLVKFSTGCKIYTRMKRLVTDNTAAYLFGVSVMKKIVLCKINIWRKHLKAVLNLYRSKLVGSSL